jgi:hypothetical protein
MLERSSREVVVYRPIIWLHGGQFQAEMAKSQGWRYQRMANRPPFGMNAHISLNKGHPKPPTHRAVCAIRKMARTLSTQIHKSI